MTCKSAHDKIFMKNISPMSYASILAGIKLPVDKMTQSVIDNLVILANASPGTKLNKQTMKWENSLGILRWYRGDSKQDIIDILKDICDDIGFVTDRQQIELLKPHIRAAFVGLDIICETYASHETFVDSIKRLKKLLNGYIM